MGYMSEKNNIQLDTSSITEVAYARLDTFITSLFEFKNTKIANALKKYILEDPVTGIESNIAPSIKHNLDESPFDLFNDSLNETIIETKKYINRCLKDSLNNLRHKNDDYMIGYASSWYHISRKNSSHGVHSHPNCSWCGIFYIDPGDEGNGGETHFINPLKAQYCDEGTLHKEQSSIEIIPTVGKLILFPSYLEHYQSLYTGNKERIVVAFNCIIDQVIENENLRKLS